MLEGEINQIQLVERLVELWREQFTGAIRFENDGIIKIVYFKGGDILSASTNDRADSIDEILMRAGKVSREHVKQALAKRKENESLGDALLNLGFITRKELTWARRVQVVGVIRSIAAWTEGSFTIVADYLPKRDEGTLFPLPQVLVELIVTEQDRSQFEKALDGGNAVFTKAGDFEDVWRRLGLNEDAEAIVREIDGSKNAGEVATVSGRDTFNVYKLLHALATLGVLTRAEKPRAQPEFSLDDFATAGVADAADMWNQPEPVAAAAPQFELDDAISPPTLDIPAIAIPVEAPSYPIADEPMVPPSASPSTSAWDDETEEVPLAVAAAPPVQETPLPAWDAPRPPKIVPDEPRYKLDEEVQIETPKAVEAPPPIGERTATKRVGLPPAKKAHRRSALWFALPIILLLGGAAYFGWQWWLTQQEPAAVVVNRPVGRPVPPPESPTTTAADTAVPTPLVVASTAPATTTTAPEPAPPAPAPMRITPTPAPPATTALPRVTPSSNGRERYDAMARNFAANATGNFTVQIQILCDASNLEKAMRAGGDNVWFVPQAIGARSCYRVFWGRYDTREEAQSALAQVPASIRDRSSAVKPIPKG